MKAVGQFAGGINAYNAGKYTRSMMAVNAQNTLNAGVSERDAIRDRADQIIGAQQVAQGASGFQTGTGTALDMLKQSAGNRELDILTSRMKANNEAKDFTQQGYFAYQKGKSAMAGGILNGASTIAQEIAEAVAGVPPTGGGGGGDFGGAGSMDSMGGSIGADYASGGFGTSTMYGDNLGDSFTVGGVY